MGEKIMMSFCDRWVLKLYGVVSLVGSLLLFSFYFHFIELSQFSHYLSCVPFACQHSAKLFIGILLFLIAMSLFNLSRSHFKKKKMIFFHMDQGSVSIELSAIEGYVSKICDQFPQIDSYKNRILTKGKNLCLFSKLYLNNKNNLKNFTGIFQKEIEKKVSNVIGFSVPFISQIHIVKIVNSEYSENLECSQKDISEEEEKKQSFDGIKY